MLALLKVNKFSTIGGRLQKTTKWEPDCALSLAKASVHYCNFYIIIIKIKIKIKIIYIYDVINFILFNEYK